MMQDPSLIIDGCHGLTHCVELTGAKTLLTSIKETTLLSDNGDELEGGDQQEEHLEAEPNDENDDEILRDRDASSKPRDNI